MPEIEGERLAINLFNIYFFSITIIKMSLTLKASDHAWKEHIRTREDALGKELKLERSLLKYFHENRRLLPKTMPKVKNPGIFYSHAMVCHRFGMHMKLAFAVFDRISEVSNLPSREIKQMRVALEALFAAPTSLLLLNMDNFKVNAMKWMGNELLMEFFSTSNDQWNKMVDFLDQDRVKKKLLRALNQPALRGGSKNTSSIFDELVEEMVELKGGEDKCNGKKRDDCMKDEDCEYVPGAKSGNGRLPYCHSKYEDLAKTNARPKTILYLVLLCILVLGVMGWDTKKYWFSADKDTWTREKVITNFKDFNNIQFFPGHIQQLVQNVQTIASLTAAVSSMMSIGMTMYMFGFVNPTAMGAAVLGRGALSYFESQAFQQLKVVTELMEVYGTFYGTLFALSYGLVEYCVMADQKVRRRKDMIGPGQVATKAFASYITKIVALSTTTLNIASETSGNMDAKIAMALLMFSGLGGASWMYGSYIKKMFQENFGRSMTDEEFNKLGSEVEKRSRRQIGTAKKKTNTNSNALLEYNNNNNVPKKKKTRPKCKCMTDAGRQCKRYAVRGSEYCTQHTKNCFMDMRNMPDDESKTGD